MARVVQRSGPPYLAIVFAFLFFITAVLAGFIYAKKVEQTKIADQLTSTLNSLSKSSERNDQLMSEQKNRASANRNSVIGQYRADQKQLIKCITGTDTSSITEALTISEQILESTEAEGFNQYLNIINTALAEASKQAKAKQMLFEQLKAKTDADAAASAAAQADLTDQLKAAKDMAAKAQARLDEISNSYTASVETANKDWSGRVEQLQGELAQREDQIRQLQQEIKALEIQIAETDSDDKAKLPDADLAADAKIIRLVDRQSVVYIDIGSMQGVRVGLPFTVYSQRTGVLPDSPGKARIIVKNVGQRVAECQIIRDNPADPISLNDPVANAAFSIGASPLFVVAGSFDLNEDGFIDRDGLEAVKAMIKRFGGRLTNEVTVEVDYVVMGSKPLSTQRPGAEAPASELELWKQNEKSIELYDQLIKQAVDYNKPILNTNRFKTFIGYVPEMDE